jgi:hypothetical protein
LRSRQQTKNPATGTDLASASLAAAQIAINTRVTANRLTEPEKLRGPHYALYVYAFRKHFEFKLTRRTLRERGETG